MGDQPCGVKHLKDAVDDGVLGFDVEVRVREGFLLVT
jgi:hypothetical protein